MPTRSIIATIAVLCVLGLPWQSPAADDTAAHANVAHATHDKAHETDAASQNAGASADAHADDAHGDTAHDGHGALVGATEAGKAILENYYNSVHALDHEHTPHEIASIFTVVKTVWKKDVKLLNKQEVAQFYYYQAKNAGDQVVADYLAKQIDKYAGERRSVNTSGFGEFLGSVAYTFYKHSYGIIGLLVIAFYVWLFGTAWQYRGMIPTRWSAFAELAYESLYNLYASVMGKDEARRYLPFLGTLFLFILACNFLSLIPFLKSPSAIIFNNIGLGLCVFIYCQYIAFTRMGAGAYLYHLMGEPKDGVGWFLGVVLILPLELMGELVKPISLCLRLFGNILAEDILLLVFVMIGLQMVTVLPIIGILIPFGVPLHLLLSPLIILFSTIQALVFSFLTAAYISMKLPHHEHHHEHDSPGHDAAHGAHAHAAAH